MNTDAPTHIEKPARFLTVRFATGQFDDITLLGTGELETDDQLVITDTHILAVCKNTNERITYERGGWGVVYYRVATGNLRLRPTPPTGTPVAGV